MRLFSPLRRKAGTRAPTRGAPTPWPGPSCRGGPRGRPGGGDRNAGYNLVALTVAVTVLNVMLAAVLPLWSTAMKREREEELIFRGLQYAEGIRVFQRRFGRFPVRLQELMETEPRSLRQLWRDPMSEDGEWGLIFAGQGGPGQGNPNDPRSPRNLAQGRGPDPSEPPPQPKSNLGEEGLGRGTVAVGPIQGVHSLNDDDSLLVFLNQTRYSDWQFTVFLVTPGGAGGQAPRAGQPQQQQGQPLAGGRQRRSRTRQSLQPGQPRQPGRPVQPAQPAQPGGPLPLLNARWIGRPLPEGVQPPGGVPGMGPQGGVPGQSPANPLASDPRRRGGTLPNTFESSPTAQPPPPQQQPPPRRPP